MRAIKDLCQRHRGEVREISGEWAQVDSPFPEPATGRKFFHTQFCLSDAGLKALHTLPQRAAGERGGSWQAALANTFIRPASGGGPASGGDPSRHLLRQARVFGLPELFGNLGTQFTAKVIYEYYPTARNIVHKRLHGKQAQVRQAAAHQRKCKTGYYGHGRG